MVIKLQITKYRLNIRDVSGESILLAKDLKSAANKCPCGERLLRGLG